jgi:hypothetical protein
LPPPPIGAGTAQLVGANQSHRWIRFGKAHQPCDAFREQPVVGLNHLAVFAVGRNEAEGDIMILNDADEGFVRMNLDARILFCVVPGNVQRTVFAAIIDNNIFKVSAGLSQHALNAFGKKVLAVIDGRNHADQWFFKHVHVFVSQINGKWID